jgi:exo-beta-1,3-glucanase (GH17 family)
VIEYYDEDGNFLSWGYGAAPTPPPSPISDPHIPAPAPAEALPTDQPDVPPGPEFASVQEAPVVEEPAVEDPAPVAPPFVPELPPAPVQELPPPAQEPAPPAPVEEAPPAVPAPEVNHAAPNPDYSFGKRSGYGIGWSNYNGDESFSECKTFEQANTEWAQLSDFDVIRIYGADCGQPGIAFELAKKYNKKVFVGIYWLDERLDEQIQEVIDGVSSSGAGWDPVDTISIGNEDVHRGEKTPAEIITIVTEARNKLKAAGYNGPVVHVDSQDQILANPGLCGEGAGDYIAANIHPFFNGHNAAEDAGQFVEDQIELLRQCGAKARRKRAGFRVRAAEVGWPKAGDVNGIAIPSKENQRIALESIKSKNLNDLILFSAFDNKWMKDGPNTFGTEKFWGILDA